MHNNAIRLQQKLRTFGGVPLTHGTLLSILGAYRSPNDKIARMVDEGLLLPIKKGTYVISPDITSIPVSLPLVANLLYGPSYVSKDYALHYYGLIPERVVEVTSMTTKRGKLFDLPVGRFSYIHSPVALYAIGIDRVENADQTGFLMACPEKALCDKLLFTRNLNIRTARAMEELLFADLRVDEDLLVGFDPEVIRACMAAGLKIDMLKILLRVITSKQGGRP
ncbi:MAG TPA: hypothetical protein ENL01_03490 [Chlorobaculum parvum]|uniref:Transcriptional regulator, AbiEi antitoxin, Type IV TA system n=1 Tax=Chlorobaculum parvum TaxID=274539 RepID=A0A7C5DC62_9CHLB|nr:hypothetical protein [Chlorobaculum parvum]